MHRVLVSIRDPESTLNSLLQRGWFSDRSLAAGDIMWPNRFDTRIPAPHWVPESFLCEWDDMAETDRAALYYITQTTLTEVPDGDALVFDYNQLVSQPRDLIEAVAEHLGLACGRRTQPLLDGVSFQESYAKADLTGLREDIRRQVVESYEASKRRCIRL